MAQFLAGLDAGSVVCDVGCGNGRYLTSHNPYIYTVGVDRCYRLSKISKGRGAEVGAVMFVENYLIVSNRFVWTQLFAGSTL